MGVYTDDVTSGDPFFFIINIMNMRKMKHTTMPPIITGFLYHAAFCSGGGGGAGGGGGGGDEPEALMPDVH